MPSNDATSYPPPTSGHDDQDANSATPKALALETGAASGTSNSFGVDASDLDIIPWS